METKCAFIYLFIFRGEEVLVEGRREENVLEKKAIRR